MGHPGTLSVPESVEPSARSTRSGYAITFLEVEDLRFSKELLECVKQTISLLLSHRSRTSVRDLP